MLADTRLNLLELVKFEQLFGAWLVAQTSCKSVPEHLILSHRRCTSVPSGWLRVLLESLDGLDSARPACMLILSNCAINAVYNRPNRRWRPVWHTIGELNVALLLGLIATLIVALQLGAIVVLLRSRILDAQVGVRLSEPVLGGSSCHSVLSGELVQELVVLVIGCGSHPVLVCLPISRHYAGTKFEF